MWTCDDCKQTVANEDDPCACDALGLCDGDKEEGRKARTSYEAGVAEGRALGAATEREAIAVRVVELARQWWRAGDRHAIPISDALTDLVVEIRSGRASAATPSKAGT